MKYCVLKFSGRNKELADRLNRLHPPTHKATEGKKTEPTKIISDGLPNLDNLIDEKIWWDCQQDLINSEQEI